MKNTKKYYFSCVSSFVVVAASMACCGVPQGWKRIDVSKDNGLRCLVISNMEVVVWCRHARRMKVVVVIRLVRMGYNSCSCIGELPRFFETQKAIRSCTE